MLSLTKQFLRSQIQVPPSAAFSTEVKRHITLYQHPISPPCRAVIMAAKLIGVDLELKLVQIKDCKTQEFLKINPLKRIPVLDDGGFLLSESRAILTYLSDKYGKDDSLYPRDLQARAIIDQMFYFDMGTLYQAMVDYWNYCVLKDNPHDEERYRRVFGPLNLFNETLGVSKFAAGPKFSLADVSLLASVSAIDAIGVDLTKYPNIHSWSDRSQKMVPNYEEINSKGVEQIKEKFRAWEDKFRPKK
uniref:Glutathione S-transferase D2 n=1 Tax=Bemisia tabaci TaxID=7038 RepID=A0A223FQX0_BEMTA|nr:glutathione S-transferase d3 [Bemisia tabaci]QHU79960.1 glutathione S-transferase D2 [Bemisia tabaci]QHU79964.1 glutathione S-transferase D2 [Bemisia tabaci]